MNKSGAKGALAGGGIVAALTLAVTLTGTLDKLGLASDAEIKDLPTKAEIIEILEPLRKELEELKKETGQTDERVRGISTNLAAFQGAWLEWKENQ